MNISLKEWMKKVTSALVRPNMWTGIASTGISTTVSYDNGADYLSTSYTTNTGRFIVIGAVPLRTSRYTSRAVIKVNGTIQGFAGTNKTTTTTVMPMVTYNGTKGATYTVTLAIGSQDSGTTAYADAYNAANLIIFDVGGYCLNAVISRLSAILHRSCQGVM